MDAEFINILYILAKSVPVIAVLWLCVRYFLKKEKGYINKINELQEELRKNERETLTIMNKLTTTLDRVIESNEEDREEILKEIKNLSTTLNRKLNDLRKEK